MSRRLEVLLHGRPIGHLAEQPDGGVELRFLESYLEAVPRPVLGQKFEDNLERAFRNRKGQRLPDFFANLLPEGALRAMIEKTAGIERGDDLALLAFVGGDLPGAVVARAEEAFWGGAPPTALEGASDSPESRPTVEGLRFSLAGVQLKFSMLLKEKKLTLPARDEDGDWIVKFPSPAFPFLPETELSILTWAARVGFDVPEHRLHPIEAVEGFPRAQAPEGARVLAIRRYDRGAGGRIHQEDFAQVVGLPPEKKYDQVGYGDLALLLRRIVDEEAADELIRRLALVVASGNNDAHLKNWSLLYPDAIRARWAPVYDQVATVSWTAPDRQLALKLGGRKEFHRLDGEALERLAHEARMSPPQVLRLFTETLASLRSEWRAIAGDLPLPPEHARALSRHWQRVPLLREAGGLE